MSQSLLAHVSGQNTGDRVQGKEGRLRVGQLSASPHGEKALNFSVFKKGINVASGMEIIRKRNQTQTEGREERCSVKVCRVQA